MMLLLQSLMGLNYHGLKLLLVHSLGIGAPQLDPLGINLNILRTCPHELSRWDPPPLFHASRNRLLLTQSPRSGLLYPDHQGLDPSCWTQLSPGHLSALRLGTICYGVSIHCYC